jgi:flagellar motor switch protein FliG
MAEIDYDKLSRRQKLAILLIVIGSEAAAEVLRQFDDQEVEALCREMSEFTMIPDTLQKKVLEEFTGVVAPSVTAICGGLSYAQRTLGIAKGDFKASAMMTHLGPIRTSTDVVKDIGEMDGRQIFNLIKGEQPQTIALVLSYLDSAKTAEVFAHFNPEMKEEIIERLGTIESTSLELVGKIAKRLGQHFDTKVRPALHLSGGVRAVAGLLNQLDKETSKTLLTRIQDRNATLGTAVRRKMFGFEDLGRLQPADLQRVMREVDMSGLALAMKSASEPLKEKIFAALSKRAAEGLREEIDLLGAVRLKDVETSQDQIIQSVRQLEEEGQISLDNEATQLVGA